MPWPGISLGLNCLLLAATVGPPGILADGYVGCLFSERLCSNEEWCYDDYAFGRCLEAAGDVEDDDLYRYNLERESLHELSAELRRLFTLGYRWSHAYTQCRLQAMLYSYKNEMSFEPDACTHLIDQDLEGALKALEGQVPLEPQQVAIIKYTPSVDNPQSDYADEVYFPPEDERAQQELREKILSPSAIDLDDMEDPYASSQIIKRAWVPQMRRRSINPELFSEQYNTPSNFRLGKETRDALEFLPPPAPPPNGPVSYLDQNNYLTVDDIAEMYPIVKYLNDLNLTPQQIANFLTPDNYERIGELLQELEEDQQPDERFTLQYNTPDNFRAGWESRDSLLYEELPESRVYIDEEVEPINEDYGSGNPNEEEIFRERKTNLDTDEIFRELKTLQELENERFDQHWGKNDQKPRIYTEGGVVYAPQKSLMNRLDRFLDKYDLKFERRERLDVKKPGPLFNSKPKTTADTEANVLLPTMMKKEPRNPNLNPSYEQREPEELDYIHITFKNGLSTWKQGQDIIRNISSLLHLEQGAFPEGEVLPFSMIFKVNPNSKGLNASEVAKRIGLLKDELESNTGVEVQSIGIGDKNEKRIDIMLNNEHQFYIVLFMVCGVLAAMILATVVLILIKRHIKSRDKLMQLSRPDTEASKDYQDLCRTRMATKNQQQSGSDTIHGRITSLSRESEQSPSSRSSTSSWSEEPALHNMDISTGHMVLSYMEDHLKNKDRLEQEWVALCAYVAEPCETTIALKKENVEKNRYKEIVPYDHARVVLNELSNANGSDYINASSITDHDPRNPAYIATQGPLPHTAPDFWQLIWEQGAVVIVMLSRLTEGGTAMCHRYWPEEGSELYHIYEVHLVSEHIWCDDYLVRSFYLKNVRTGETRTVTQFHFLSWVEAGVPASTKALLEFRRKVNKSYRGRSCPIVVHCSDGAGRTGTYCLIDMVLSRMAKGAKEIDIAATLEHLRDQRPRMVATKQQFEFVLTAVAEEVHAILKTLPPQPSPAATTTTATTQQQPNTTNDNQKEKQ